MEHSMWIRSPKRLSSVTFVKEFDSKADVGAISITAIGFYELYLNGKKVSTDVFAPGWTDYKKRVQCQTYTLKLEGHNRIEIMLGEGFGGGDNFAWRTKGTYNYFEMGLRFVLKHGDETIVSDESLDVYSNHIVTSDIYNGETWDDLKEIEYLGKAVAAKDIVTNIIRQEGEHIVYGERIAPVKFFTTPKGEKVIDFGQNFAGIVEVKVKGKRGDKITYVPGEVLDSEGNFYNENYRAAKSLYSFVLTGEEQVFRPHFSYLGGRYIKLIECPDYVREDAFTAVLVHSELTRTCAFETGNAMINRLYKNVIYGQLSNYLDVPTDCPQRDERLGWTADTAVFAETGSINFKTDRFMKKWLADLRLDQGKDGQVYSLCPRFYHGDGDNLVSTGWGDAITIVPRSLYRTYGDPSFLADNFNAMEKWVAHLQKHQVKENIIKLDWTFGDWLGLDRDKETLHYVGATDTELMSTAFYALAVMTIIEAGHELSYDVSAYEELLPKIKEAYQNEFIKDGHMAGPVAHMWYGKERTPNTQTGIAMTLAYGLCKEEDRATLTKDLADNVRACGKKMTTGFIGTPLILSALSDNGEKELAYDLLLSEEFPAWLYSVKNGATTIWEHFDGVREDGTFRDKTMNSFNHYAYGSVFSWMFKNIAGIKPIKAGYSEISITPLVEKRIGFENCVFYSKHGMISSSWKINDDGGVEYSFAVPEGVKAHIKLEDGFEVTLENGGTINHLSKAAK